MRRVGVFALLVGLWVMHGMSGTTDAGCHGATMPMFGLTQASNSAVPAASSAAMTTMDDTRGTALSPASMDQMHHGDLCVSGRPPTPGSLFIALLGLLALLGCILAAALPRGLGPARTPGALGRSWRAPPGLAGRRLLTAVCVART